MKIKEDLRTQEGQRILNLKNPRLAENTSSHVLEEQELGLSHYSPFAEANSAHWETNLKMVVGLSSQRKIDERLLRRMIQDAWKAELGYSPRIAVKMTSCSGRRLCHSTGESSPSSIRGRFIDRPIRRESKTYEILELWNSLKENSQQTEVA